jgi:hypothetical protein
VCPDGPTQGKLRPGLISVDHLTDIQAEFKGNKAKLEWVVSLDGKRMQSETYKVLAVMDKPTSSPAK